MNFLFPIFGDPNKRFIQSLRPLVESINRLEHTFEQFSDEKIQEKTKELKGLLIKGKTLDDLLPEAFALVRGASKRALGQRHFDVQLIGGIVLHQGKIAEMKTGEGKTLTATLAVYLNALEGKGVHIVTVNDYLAKRDTVWMGQIYHALGLSVACITHDSSHVYDPTYQHQEIQNSKIPEGKPSASYGAGKSSKFKTGESDRERDVRRDTTGSFKVEESYLRPVSRKEAYLADITYGTNNEFGFDYLRDNLVYDIAQKVQRDFNYAIVDEVDSILIDEARTPLIISMPDEESSKMYETFSRLVPRLKENEDYNVDEKLRAVTLTEQGIQKVEKMLGMGNIYVEGGMRYVHHLEQALRAHILFKRDRDYVVKDGQIIIVDEFTGRLLHGRRYSEGLHQAIEAKEGVSIQRESRTLASITFQNYFRMYKKLAGMTGTAATNAEEFHKVYNLDVVVIPTNKPMIRTDLPDSVYKTEQGKFRAVVQEIKQRHSKGQPVLVGTVSIEKNEFLSQLLSREGIPHEVLNAKHHEKEGVIIAQAGKLGAVTVATNMAGRGVDIILGGNPPHDPDQSREIIELGGLHVIGTERHEARRIDNQLRGRSGRQGDPGSSQFFVSLEDDLMRIFGGDKIKSVMETLGIPEDEPIENSFISSAIESAQSRIEGYYFDIRKHLLEYDDVINRHREVVYKKRREVLEKENLTDDIHDMIKKEIKRIVEFHSQGPDASVWNLEEMVEVCRSLFGMPLGEIHEKLIDSIRSLLPPEEKRREIIKILFAQAKLHYEQLEQNYGKDNMQKALQVLILRSLDFHWMQHLEDMEYLRDSVRLRAYGQHDPLVEYKSEGHRMFRDLLDRVRFTVVGSLFKIQGAVSNQHDQPYQIDQSKVGRHPERGMGQAKLGRNDPCPCGAVNPATGQPYKYKRCGMINAAQHKG